MSVDYEAALDVSQDSALFLSGLLYDGRCVGAEEGHSGDGTCKQGNATNGYPESLTVHTLRSPAGAVTSSRPSTHHS